MATRKTRAPRNYVREGLLIRSPFIDQILAGKKTWEIRGSRTHKRGRIALIRSGSGQIVGTCEIVECIGPLSLADLNRHARKTGDKPGDWKSKPYPRPFAWVLRKAKRLRRPRPYRHPYGAIAWVKLRVRGL
jgi:hypothetical protein